MFITAGMLDREIQVVNGKKTLIRKADKTGIGRDKAQGAQKGGQKDGGQNDPRIGPEGERPPSAVGASRR